jgi:vacuolar-type H+-ATPase subunit C/Vma6
LPQLALAELARQPSPAAVVQQLLLLSHPDAPRLLTVVRQAQVDLLAVDTALLLGFADRATRVADGGDEPLRQFVGALIDTGNAQNALVLAGEPVEGDRARLFVRGGRWLSASTFLSIAAAGSQQRAWAALRTAVANSPLASWLPIAAGGADHVDRLVLGAALEQLGRAARVEPMSSAPVLRVLLLIEAQTRDLRALAWGAALGAPPSLRRQELVTPT